MNVYLLDTPLRIHAPDPVEVVALVDGKTLRVMIEWPAVVRLFESEHAEHVSADNVAAAIRRHRRAIALAIEAQLFANGIPLARQLVMSLDDLRATGAFDSADDALEVAALGHA